jgi:hypothetical protein
MTQRIIVGAERLRVVRARRRQFAATGIGVVLILGVASAAFAVPMMRPATVAAPTPTASSSPTPTATPAPSPSPTATTAPEPAQFAIAQSDADHVPGFVTGDFDSASTRFVAADDSVRYFVARGTAGAGPYCLILVSSVSEDWVLGCGDLRGVRVSGATLGEALLSNPGTAPQGWQALDEFVSVNPDAPRETPDPPVAEQPADPYTVEDVQVALDAIGPDSAGATDSQKAAQTSALASDAASQLGAPVALIRPTWVGFPDEQTGSVNSLMWWVVTSEPTQFPWSYTHQVNGVDWQGWGQGDRDLGALQARLSAWLSANDAGRGWVVVTQTH